MPTASSTFCSHTNPYWLCPFAPLPLQELHHYYGLMPRGLTGHFLPVRQGWHLTCTGMYRSAVHGSFVPYILALHLVLARPSDPAAITGLCDWLPVTFDHSGFLPFSTKTYFNGDSTPHGEDGCVIIPSFTSLTLRTFVDCNKIYWTWLIYSFLRLSKLSQASSPLFTELRTIHLSQWNARRRLEFL